MTSNTFNSAFILYVEDHAMSRTIMELLFKTAMGIENFAIFENSDNFWARLRALPQIPALILLDIHVKPLDGFEMLAIIRSNAEFRDCRVIALTASVMNEEVEEMRRAGFDGAIGKPLNITDFPDSIERILKGESIWKV